MFDSVIISMNCPKCNQWDSFEFQTKDLSCVMDTYYPLPEDWETSDWGKKMRKDLPVFRKFPLDREQNVWKDQAEKIEAKATLEPPYDTQLKFVNIHTTCCKCKARLEGTIAVVDGKLRLPVIGAMK